MSQENLAELDFVNEANQWRMITPGSEGWARGARPGDARGKYFIVTTDSHMTVPPSLFPERIDRKYLDRLPRQIEKDGKKFMLQDGFSPTPIATTPVEGEDALRTKIGAYITAGPRTMADRIADQDRDGVDAEIIFPNGPALLLWATTDIDFMMAQARIWNDWAMEECTGHLHRAKPIAAIPTANIEMAVAEVQRVAKLGYDVICLPNKPIFAPPTLGDANYNLPIYDPLWAAIQDSGMSMVFHVSTGQDPRTARGNGGAIMNYCIHSLAPTLEPVVSLCASGVIERFPGLRLAVIEANGGWLPWLLDRMDEGYRTHHMWVHPKLKALPSDYFRMAGAVSVDEDRAALLLCEEYGLENNMMFANDYPHHEGSWPHSAETIERTFGRLREDTRAKVLGLNAARMFKFDIPKG